LCVVPASCLGLSFTDLVAAVMLWSFSAFDMVSWLSWRETADGCQVSSRRPIVMRLASAYGDAASRAGGM
jgi:hypothetical protein